MAKRFCGSCGSLLRSPDQKFCAECGAPVPPPDPSAVSPSPVSPSSAGIPLWLLAAAAIAVILTAFFVGIPLLSQTVPAGTSAGTHAGTHAGSAGMGSVPSPGVSTAPLETTSSENNDVTATVPATPPPGTTSSPLLTTPATPTPSLAPATPEPTEIVVTLPTSQITLAVTKVPPQPSAASLASSTPGAPYIDPVSLEARIHDLINARRQQNGLMPLSYDSFLADIARGHSWDMVKRQFFDHVNPDGKDPKTRGDDAGYPCIRTYKSYSTIGIAENLFQGNRYSAYYTAPNGTVVSYDWNTAEQVAQSVVNGWMNSPGQWKNILTDTYYQEGIGVSFSPDDKIYVTENFC